MSEEQEFEFIPDEDEVYEEPVAEVFTAKTGELFGEPSTAASFYHCSHCSDDVLAQDVVWDQEDQPHCPDCGSTLTRRP